MAKWPSVTISTPEGPREGLAPAVISASRATDLPAFHMDWFMERLRAGYCVWVNPFRPSQRQWVSFACCRDLVFWSKDPRPLLPHLDELAERGYTVRLHFTLNDYEAEGLEPRVPPLVTRLQTFGTFAERLGPERIFWRFDPLLVSAALTPPLLLERLARIGSVLAPCTRKLIFSFLDDYHHARRRLAALDPTLRSPDANERRQLVEGLSRLGRHWGLTLSACAEAEDWSAFGVERGCCIQGQSRDKGQRKACGCAPAKDIGAYNTCGHQCVYCYATHGVRTPGEEIC